MTGPFETIGGVAGAIGGGFAGGVAGFGLGGGGGLVAGGATGGVFGGPAGAAVGGAGGAVAGAALGAGAGTLVGGAAGAQVGSTAGRAVDDWIRGNREAERLRKGDQKKCTGHCVAADQNDESDADPNTQKKPPPGSRGIYQTEWSGDHQGIKGGVGAGPADDVKISPAGDVWAENTDGTWTNHGPAGSFTASGEPSGRTGRDREKPWRR